MTKSLIAVGVAGGILTVVMVIWRRLREDARVRRMAMENDLIPLERGRRRMRQDLAETVLARFGHSRRFRHCYAASSGVRLASFVFETGTESNRAVHSWRVAVIDVEALARYGILTCDATFMSAGRIRRLAPMSNLTDRSDPTPHSPHVLLTDDESYWQGVLSPELRQFLTQQSRDRTWEFLSGRLVAYEPGLFTEKEIVAMADQVARCAQLFADASRSEGTTSFAGEPVLGAVVG